MPYLLTDGYVLTMDDRRSTHPRGFVLTDAAGQIAAVGPMDECPDAPDAERVDCAGKVVLPGLIDALHVHWTHLFAGMQPDPALAGAMDAEAHQIAAGLAASALAAGGVTTALIEMPATLDAATINALMPVFAARGVRAIAAVAPALAGEVANAAVSVLANPRSLAEGRASEATIRDGIETARALGRQALLRAAPQGADAATQTAEGRRMARSTVYHLMEMGLLDSGCLLVCPPVLDDLDRSLILESGCHVIGLPVADGLRGAGSGALSALARAGAPCALGTEGPGTGWTTDMIEQIKAATMIQNTLLLDPTAMSLERALEMATRNAAVALGLGTQTGALAIGLRADIAVFDAHHPHQQIAAKAISAFLATTRATEAAFVLSGGMRTLPVPSIDITRAVAARRATLARAGLGVAA